ncbi:MAG: tRNA (adenosine(37)-N6)-threonylcarbamoyltransferase complex ATPase subunit type 1 TsaE [bacterium]
MPVKMKTEWCVTRENLNKVAAIVAQELLKSERFVLWLRGELGAGKTTFAGELLRALGLPPSVPVLSPTFTFMTEYQTANGLIGHLDLYRLSNDDHEAADFLLSDRDFRGLIVEWPERAAKAASLQKTHELSFIFTDQIDERKLDFATAN